MRITKIEFENFRQFKDRNVIDCSSESNITLVYGKNGNGKTTLHQLFQWVFYGNLNFNKTTTEKLYNLDYEKTLRHGDQTTTWGTIDFSHGGEQYSIRREALFKKEMSKIKQINTSVELLKWDETISNWSPYAEKERDIKRAIDQILPSALNDYFFFDGENMIADLRKKGQASAKSLRSALFSMFDLSFLENAIKHIGDTDKRSTVIGSLFASKTVDRGDSAAMDAKDKMQAAQDKIEFITSRLIELNESIEENKNRIIEISETIGSVKSAKEYENERKEFKKKIEKEYNRIETDKKEFGKTLYEVYPKILLRKRFNYAKTRIEQRMEESGKDLPFGLEKDLIETLLSPGRTTCICGNPITEKERSNLEKYLRLFPPYSYTALYNNFINLFKTMGKSSDNDKINNVLFRIMDSLNNIEDYEKEIEKVDLEIKKTESLQSLIEERIQLEANNEENQNELGILNGQKGLAETVYKQQKKKYEEYTSSTKSNQLIDEKIKVLEEVKSMFEKELDNSAKIYSEQLKLNIEMLLKEMLTSRRSVSVSKDFMVKIYDSYGDESKSEGQFAVVSFAYIGAILKLLKEEEALRNKEFPLVLDGPFSKLDENQKSNVIKVIPNFAPQIILFSKDLLEEYLENSESINTWLIYSNPEKNYSKFELANSGEIQEYFELDGDIIWQ